jgi:hypothetical protein
VIVSGNSGPNGGIARWGELYHVWRLPGGGDWLRFFRTSQGYVLQFPDLAEFAISRDGTSISSRALSGASQETIEHLYQNQVLPLALSCQRKLVFHGSAVVVDGGALAFLGQSGMGKSTLATAFALNGAKLITDDGLHIEQSDDGQWQARPGHGSLRLWPDSRAALLPPGTGRVQAAGYTAKFRILTDGCIGFSTAPAPLRQVYFLRQEGAGEINIEAVSAADALIELVSHAFLLDLDDRDLIARHFDHLARMVEFPHFYRLDFPRRYSVLGEVRQKILANLGADV